jgi:uncharacterized protein (UPF0335 family)
MQEVVVQGETLPAPRGHNRKRSNDPRDYGFKPTDTLRHYLDRLVALEVDRREITLSFNDVLELASDQGHHKRALRTLVKRMLESTEDESKRKAYEDALDDMLARLGMLRDTPLGEAAERAFTGR